MLLRHFSYFCSGISSRTFLLWPLCRPKQSVCIYNDCLLRVTISRFNWGLFNRWVYSFNRCDAVMVDQQICWVFGNLHVCDNEDIKSQLQYMSIPYIRNTHSIWSLGTWTQGLGSKHYLELNQRVCFLLQSSDVPMCLLVLTITAVY